MKYLKSRTRQIVLPLLVLALTLGLLYGCSSFNRGVVYKEWTRTMSELGIYPIFPPRENVQVGDVWVLPMHPFNTGAVETVGGLGSTGIWLNNIIDNEIVSKFYNKRFCFPTTSSLGTDTAFINFGTSASHLDNIIKIPELSVDGTGAVDVFRGGSVTRLRQVAFPEFAVTNISKMAMNAIVPIEAITVAGGFTSNSIKQISLKIPLAESYGIPVQLLLQPLLNNDKNFDLDNKKNLWIKSWDGKNSDIGIPGLTNETALIARSMFNDGLIAMQGSLKQEKVSGKIMNYLSKVSEKSTNSIWVAVINEVFYARAIDINIRTKKARGGGINVQPITNQMLLELDRLKSIGSKTTTTTKVGTDTAGREITETTEIKEGDDAFELAKKINQFNVNLGKQSVPGGSINVVSVSDTNVGLRRIYDRPIAVGARGVIIRLDVTDTSKDGYIKIETKDFPGERK